MSLGLLRPCLDCGEPSTESRCPDHTVERSAVRVRETAEERGYDSQWRKLSKRARRLQPFCGRCGSRRNTGTDHLPIAWHRKANGLPIRLADVEVLCASCQMIVGSSRPGSHRYAEWEANR